MRHSLIAKLYFFALLVMHDKCKYFVHAEKILIATQMRNNRRMAQIGQIPHIHSFRGWGLWWGFQLLFLNPKLVKSRSPIFSVGWGVGGGWGRLWWVLQLLFTSQKLFKSQSSMFLAWWGCFQNHSWVQNWLNIKVPYFLLFCFGEGLGVDLVP